MHRKRKDHEFLDWARNIANTCRKQQTNWGLDVPLVEQLIAELSAATSAYGYNTDPAHKSHDTAAVKQLAFANLKRTLSVLINSLEGNRKVPDDALNSMQLRPRHPGSHQPHPAPAETPVLTVLTGQHHDVTAYVSTLQYGHPTEFLDTKHYYGFLLRYQFEGDPDWQQLVSTKKHKTLVFADDQEGKYIKLQAAWVNPRIEPGPWSEVVRELVN
ncbi:MAG: hypothetical protein LBK76_09715 [Verrucomicrobiales bacterium]|jgi:hypothetical protein|nr:hypothetical protein [Verrucomicrobiales bacterium]